MNGYENVGLEAENQHTALKRLHFTANPVDCWKEIIKLGKSFPELESLVVANCPIKALVGNNDFDDNEQDPHDCFKVLFLWNYSYY